jgi:hypothetical protein
MSDRLNAKCKACGHVWTLLWLPVEPSVMSKFAKLPCPKCYAPKPTLAGKDDHPTGDNHDILQRVLETISGWAPNPVDVSPIEWNTLAADIRTALGVVA